MNASIGAARVEVVLGDITDETTDAIVNAANSSLLGGGGVDGAIHRAGGAEILEECGVLGGCETGDAKITTAGMMPAKHVIHTVGPVYHDGRHDESRLLSSCHRRSLEVADEAALTSISFPAISCGVYGYPVREAAQIAMTATKDYLRSATGIEHVRFVLFSQDVYDAYVKALACVGTDLPLPDA